MRESAYQAVLEEVLTAAIEAASARATEPASDFVSGEIMAYYDIITIAQEQARQMGIEFADRSLGEFDAEVLLRKPTA